MTHGSLFSGIGGFDLAAEWMGWENVFHCEREPFAQRVLAHYWPESKLYEDVTTFDATKYRGTIDVLTGGFPCQPYSTAGKRLGKDDERHLWPHMLRIIREVAPRYIVGENVYGLVSWSGGLVFEEVCMDLENAGYEVQPYVLPASAVGAPHERKRVWFVAHANQRYDGRTAGKDAGTCGKERVQKRNEVRKFVEPSEVQRDATDASRTNGKQKIKRGRGEQGSERDEIRRFSESISGERDAAHADNRSRPSNTVRAGRQEFTLSPWANFPTQSPVCGGDDGLSRELDGITFPKWRKESIKGYGNAVVPQLVYELFQAIQAYEEAKDPPTKGNSQT